MPRSARIDAPGLTHHVLARGIEKRHIFIDDSDRDDFVKRMACIGGADKMQIYAFSLMPNHFHLLVRTLSMPLSTFMCRLLTGYSNYFNRRHKRSGHLFQNRFKSFVVEDQLYLLELVRYIHLNPVRAGIIDEKSLETWRYSGHSSLIGNVKSDFLSKDEILAHWALTEGTARDQLKQHMREGLNLGNQPNLLGGGFKVSFENKQKENNDKKLSDERILGSSEFVDRVLNAVKAQAEPPKISLEDLTKRVADDFGMTTTELCSGSKRSVVVKARARAIWLGTKEYGFAGSKLAEALNICPTTVYMSIRTATDARVNAGHESNCSN